MIEIFLRFYELLLDKNDRKLCDKTAVTNNKHSQKIILILVDLN